MSSCSKGERSVKADDSTLSTVSCTLASLLSLTDIHAPPLPPRKRVRLR